MLSRPLGGATAWPKNWSGGMTSTGSGLDCHHAVPPVPPRAATDAGGAWAAAPAQELPGAMVLI